MKIARFKDNIRILSVLTLAFLLTGCDLSEIIHRKEAKEEKIILGPEELQKSRIKTVQNLLEKNSFDPGSIDGKMGWRTRDAIKEFQKAKKLKVSGYIDTKTWAELNQPIKKDKKSISKQPKNIREMQLALKRAGFDPGAIDGKMGAKTKRALMAFQKSKGLAVSGILDDKTAKELEEYLTDR